LMTIYGINIMFKSKTITLQITFNAPQKSKPKTAKKA